MGDFDQDSMCLIAKCLKLTNYLDRDQRGSSWLRGSLGSVTEPMDELLLEKLFFVTRLFDDFTESSVKLAGSSIAKAPVFFAVCTCSGFVKGSSVDWLA